MKEDAVVNEMVDSSGMQYAVIAGLRTETGPERLVIAYPSKKSPRDLIAAASIIAVGFSSREEAVADSRASVQTAVSSAERMQAAIARSTEGRQLRLHLAEPRAEIASALCRAAKFLVASYRDVASTVAVIFFSTNAISAVIRMALGSPI